MTTDETTADVFYCARHPSVETLLRCGRCETPICPKCAVFTDVGARCPTCAPRKKLPQFEVSPIWLLRGAGAAIVAGAGVGGLWGGLLPGGLGFFGIFLGLGFGWIIAEAIGLATNRKVGPTMQGAAVAGMVVAYLVRNVVAGYDIIPSNDLGGLITLGAGIIFAINRLRF